MQTGSGQGPQESPAAFATIRIFSILPPFTGNGFTSAMNGQIIPEFYSEGLSLNDGAQMIEITNGEPIVKAVYDSSKGKFIPVKNH